MPGITQKLGYNFQNMARVEIKCNLAYRIVHKRVGWIK